MEKQLKDYLHLYIGCEVVDENGLLGLATLVGVSQDAALLIHVATGSYGEDRTFSVKPILRRLEDMTEDELMEIVKEIYLSVYDYECEFERGTMPTPAHGDEVGISCYDQEGCRIGLSIEKERGIDFSVDGTKLMVDQFHYTKHLLELGLDLFGLIPSGLAIDAKSLQP